ncbi:MAG: hypothetical protein ACRDNS_22920, partial [Trebonia sp.]
GARPPAANTPYGRLSRPNGDPSGISIALIAPPSVRTPRTIPQDYRTGPPPRATGSVDKEVNRDRPAGRGRKSLGTLAASVAADRALPAVWFTPLLTEPQVPEALRRATAPFLLIGGTADDWWDGDVARSVTPHVVEISGADHGLFAPGPLKESAAVLAEVSTAVERFLDQVVWPVSLSA